MKRATVSGGPYTQVATSTFAGYTNVGLTNGTTYYVSVKASDLAQNGYPAGSTALAKGAAGLKDAKVTP